MVLMTKRLFDIDDDLLERAQLALGTATMSETVREALRRVTESDPGEAYVALLAGLEPVDRSAAWR
jgi:Arc/MetJ family transcription regulator